METIGTILAMNIFVISILIMLFFLDEEGAFTKFMHIGPEKNTTFLNIKLDSWTKVVLVYIISFGSAFLQYFYISHIQTGFIMSKLTNPAVKELDMTYDEAKYLIWTNNISLWIISIIRFMVTLTMQFQFMFFLLLGAMVTQIPFYHANLREKKTRK
jgi:hypothetical protein